MVTTTNLLLCTCYSIITDSSKLNFINHHCDRLIADPIFRRLVRDDGQGGLLIQWFTELKGATLITFVNSMIVRYMLLKVAIILGSTRH
jgi:hypothetical protein